MRKGLVGLRHLVDFVAFADGVPLPLIGFEDFRRERGLHRRAFAGVREIHDPAQGERVLAVGRNFQRHLIGRATDAAGLVSMRGLALSTARCKISIGLLAGFFSEMLSNAP
jgi:hypothetical protein